MKKISHHFILAMKRICKQASGELIKRANKSYRSLMRLPSAVADSHLNRTRCADRDGIPAAVVLMLIKIEQAAQILSVLILSVAYTVG